MQDAPEEEDQSFILAQSEDVNKLFMKKSVSHQTELDHINPIEHSRS